MKSRSILTLAAMLSALLLLTACKKPEEPSTPANPDPKAAPQAEESAPGTTTNFETPPPAEPEKPAEQ